MFHTHDNPVTGATIPLYRRQTWGTEHHQCVQENKGTVKPKVHTGRTGFGVCELKNCSQLPHTTAKTTWDTKKWAENKVWTVQPDNTPQADGTVCLPPGVTNPSVTVHLTPLPWATFPSLQ